MAVPKLRFKTEHEQQIWSECSRLITNCIIYYNATILSDLLRLREQQGDARQVALLEHVSPVVWQHTNFHGRFEFRSSPERIDIAAMVQELARYPIQSIPIPSAGLNPVGRYAKNPMYAPEGLC